METTVPKEVKNIRPDTTVDWEPQVLEDWMGENGEVGLQWLSEAIGKNKLYLYNCRTRKRIGRDALIKLQELTGIPKSFFMGNKPLPKEEEKDMEKDMPKGMEKELDEKPVRVYTAPASEFGIEDKKPTIVPMPPKGWICLQMIDRKIFLRMSDIIDVEKLMCGTIVRTSFGAYEVIDDAQWIMERMAEC